MLPRRKKPMHQPHQRGLTTIDLLPNQQTQKRHTHNNRKGRLLSLTLRRFSRINRCSSPYARIVATPFNVSPKCWKIGLFEILSNRLSSTLDRKYAVPISTNMAVMTTPARRKAGVMTEINTTIVVTVRISLQTEINTHDVS